MHRLLAGLAVLGCAGLAVIGFNNFGTRPIQGEQAAFHVVNDSYVRVTLEVQRDDPRRPAECVIRARAESGEEVGRKEVLIPPAGGTVRHDAILRTSSRSVVGEVYGCSYNVPEYLSNPTRPTG